MENNTLTWRFIKDRNETIAIQPVQIPSNETFLGIPAKIKSAMVGANEIVRFLILLAHGQCYVEGEPNEPDEVKILAAARKKAGYVKRKAWDDEKEVIRKQAHKESAAKWQAKFIQKQCELYARWRPATFGKAHKTEKMRRMKKYLAEMPSDEREDKFRTYICRELFKINEKKHAIIRAAAEEEAQAELEEIDAIHEMLQTKYTENRKQGFEGITLYEINEFIGRHVKKPVSVNVPDVDNYTLDERLAMRDAIVKKLAASEKLRAIYNFILAECKPMGNYFNTIIPDAHMRALVEFIGEQVGSGLKSEKARQAVKDKLCLSVLLTYIGNMPKMFAIWVREYTKTHTVTPKTAQAELARRIGFIAECPGKHGVQYYPIEDFRIDRHNEGDEALYEKIMAGQRSEKKERPPEEMKPLIYPISKMPEPPPKFELREGVVYLSGKQYDCKAKIGQKRQIYFREFVSEVWKNISAQPLVRNETTDKRTYVILNVFKIMCTIYQKHNPDKAEKIKKWEHNPNEIDNTFFGDKDRKDFYEFTFKPLRTINQSVLPAGNRRAVFLT
ncbi:MAG: hypothetical protein KJ964_02475 [Verrucomicrobia bacterium]|nr:hypothetical protein [Verrucomicrobiota bacterium]